MGKNTKEFILILLLFVGIYCLYFHPTFRQFGSSLFFFGDQVDGYQVYWNTWHFSHQLLNFNNPFYTDYLLYPHKSSLWMHAYTAYYGIINLFVNNPFVAINIGIASNLIMAAVGFYYVAKKFVANKLFAFTCAFVAIFNSYILIKSGVHFNLVLIVLFPWSLHYFLSNITWKNNKVSFKNNKSIVLFFAILCCNILLDYYAVFYSLSFVILFFFYFNTFKPWLEKPTKIKYGIIALVFVLGHFIGRVLRLKGFNEKGAIWGSADIRQLFFPLKTSKFLANISFQGKIDTEDFLFLGYGLLGLFIFFLIKYFIKAKKDKWSGFLLFATLIYFMVIFPDFRLGRHKIFYFFTGLIHYIPFINQVRVSSRFIEMLFMIIPLFIFVNLDKLNIRKGLKVVATICILTVFYINHSQINRTESKSNFTNQSLQIKLKNKIVLSIPFGIRDGYSEYGTFTKNIYTSQVKYGYKNISGYFSRVNEKVFEQAKLNPFLHELVLAQVDSSYQQVNAYQLVKTYPIDAIYFNIEYLIKHPKVNELVHLAFPRSKYNWEDGLEDGIIWLKKI